MLQLSLCWDEGWPRFHDPATGAYLRNFREVEEENRRLREELRRRGGES